MSLANSSSFSNRLTEAIHEGQEYFSVPLQIGRRKLDGLRDSLVASSVWRPEFTRALGKYPEFGLVQLDFAVNGCDACHLGSRISTLSGHLAGVPYDRMGFQPLVSVLSSAWRSVLISFQNEREKKKKSAKKKEKKKRQKRNRVGSDSGSDSDSNEPSHKKEKKEFDLGRFCARRTQVYHEFMHWEVCSFYSHLLTPADPCYSTNCFVRLTKRLRTFGLSGRRRRTSNSTVLRMRVGSNHQTT